MEKKSPLIPATGLPEPEGPPFFTRLFIVAITLVTYALAFYMLAPGLMVPSLVLLLVLSLVPVAAAALYFGARFGVVTAVVVSVLTVLLMRQAGVSLWTDALALEISIGALALVVAAVLLGSFTDLRRRLRQETLTRLRAESSRRAAESQLASIMAVLDDAIFALSWPQKQVLHINPAAKRLYGRPVEEFYRSPEVFTDVVHPEDRPLVDDLFEMVQKRTEVEIAYRIYRPNGEMRWVLDRARMVYDAAGKPIRVDRLVRDITERKNSEEALLKAQGTLRNRVDERTTELQAANLRLQVELTERARAEEVARRRAGEAEESRQVLQALMAFIPEGIGIAEGPDTTVRLISRYGQDMTGRSLDLFEGVALQDQAVQWQFYHPDQSTLATSDELPLTRAVLYGEVIENEEWMMRQASGSFISVLVNAGPIRDEAGSITGGIIAWRDITERKEAQTEMRAKADQIEAQHYLLQGREMERLDIARTLHDSLLQNLITINFAFNELYRFVQDDYASKTLSAIQSSLMDQINRLRAFVGELRPPILVHFGVEKAIRSHMETFQDQYPNLHVRLDLRPDGQMLPEDVRLAFYRIYSELVTNVVRHARARHLSVCFGVEGNTAELQVTDDGHGFPVPESWSELVRDGHLGLMGVKERVDALNGALKITSDPETGTDVTISIPKYFIAERAKAIRKEYAG